jgi:hypothetical protein
MPRRHQKLTAWLGMIAIWLAVLMPVASQSWAHASSVDAALCSAAAATPAQSDRQLPHHGVHLDACGYCSLFAHTPALGAVATAALACPKPQLVAQPEATPVPRTAFRYLRSYPRAPPIGA